MTLKLFSFLLLIIFCISCSDFENENIAVNARFENNTLLIENGSNETIYYTVFNEAILPFIDWIPYSSEQNRILPNQLASIAENDIYGFEEGATFIIFYWENVESPYDNLQNIKIDAK